MDEHSISSYVWLADQLDISILGPETAEGSLYTRAEWIVRGACDIVRGGVGDVGGITPLMKVAHLAEAFGMAMEVHGGGAGNLQALGAMAIPGELYERGLLHPFVDYEEPEPWLHSPGRPDGRRGVRAPARPAGPGTRHRFRLHSRAHHRCTTLGWSAGRAGPATPRT